MIIYTLVCDGCGASVPYSDRSLRDAERRARAAGWTIDPDGRKHWCVDCTNARKEQSR